MGKLLLVILQQSLINAPKKMTEHVELSDPKCPT